MCYTERELRVSLRFRVVCYESHKGGFCDAHLFGMRLGDSESSREWLETPSRTKRYFLFANEA